MKDWVKKKISSIVDDNGLSGQEIGELIHFLRQKMTPSVDYEDDLFFKNFTYEMTGQVKELALLLIDFKKDLKSRLDTDLTDIATKYIPLATDQLEGIIETTEMAANKIMDNLETMQENDAKMKNMLAFLKNGELTSSGGKKAISPLIDDMDSRIDNNMSLISDSFLQMSFQDLTGQRIKRIIDVVRQMEEKVKGMVLSFGFKLTEKEKNPDISSDELQRVVDEKVLELAGPQKKGEGLDQSGIDELLANL